MRSIRVVRSIVVHSICVLSMVAAVPAAATTASFILMSADRSVFEEGTSVCERCDPPSSYSTKSSEASVAFGLFDEGVFGVGSDAIQTSNLLSQIISGSGEVSVGFTSDNSASSLLSVVFQVDATDQYSLSGMFSDTDGDNRIMLSSMSGNIFFRSSGGSGSTPWVENFMLEAGETYTLAAISSDFGFGSPRTGSWEFTMAVPEPSTGLLVVPGLTGLAGSRRGRR